MEINIEATQRLPTLDVASRWHTASINPHFSEKLPHTDNYMTNHLYCGHLQKYITVNESKSEKNTNRVYVMWKMVIYKKENR